MASVNPKPIEMHIADGTHRPYRHGQADELVLATGTPEMPDDLPDEVREVWEAIVPQIVALGVVKEIDVHQLVDLCRWRAMWEKWQADLTTTDPLTNEKTFSTLLRATDRAWTNWFRIAERFGLSPSDRTQLRLEKPKTDAPEARKR